MCDGKIFKGNALMIVMSDFAELNDFSSFFIFACCAKTTKQVSGVVANTFLIEEEIK